MTTHIKVPPQGKKITVNKDHTLNVPDQPIIPFIEGDGTGVDITPHNATRCGCRNCQGLQW